VILKNHTYASKIMDITISNITNTVGKNFGVEKIWKKYFRK